MALGTSPSDVKFPCCVLYLCSPLSVLLYANSFPVRIESVLLCRNSKHRDGTLLRNQAGYLRCEIYKAQTDAEICALLVDLQICSITNLNDIVE